MRFPRQQLIVFLSFSLALSCGRQPKTFDVKQRVEREVMQPRFQNPNMTAVADEGIRRRRDEQVMFLVAGSHAKEQPDFPQEPSSVTTPSRMVTVPATSSLPPDYVKQRESGGDYAAFNPTGCGGHGCYGAWQFSGAWAGKLGLPEDLATATPEQQDEAARQLWANGAGCSHWAACG